ncbi:MAG: D-alanine--D-alanine ligase [Thermoleophilaceae bacterium]|nr:D-alanine--D-alanine ligase [Thermoleophilaceae bacterium]
MPPAGTRVAVLFGGPSVEHDVSIISASQLIEVLSERHRPVPIYLARNDRFYTGQALRELSSYGPLVPSGAEPIELVLGGDAPLRIPSGSRLRAPVNPVVDVALCAIHGTGGEDGALLGALEHSGIPYAGGPVGPAAVAMDKALAKLVFADAGIETNPHSAITREQFATDRGAVLERCDAMPGFPCFVKPRSLGSSIGVARVSDSDDLDEALELCFELDRGALVEPALDEAIEINCAVIGRPGGELRASELEQPVGSGSGTLSFEDKYLRGLKGGKGQAGKVGRSAKGADGVGMASQERLIPAPIARPLADRIRETALVAHRALGFAGVVRYDFLVEAEVGRIVLNEANTVPGSFSFYLFDPVGLPFIELADTLIDIAFAEAAEQGATTRSFDSVLLSQHGGGR